MVAKSYHIWFEIECEVDHAPSDCSISVSCPVFSSKPVHLSVDNSMREERITLNVSAIIFWTLLMVFGCIGHC